MFEPDKRVRVFVSSTFRDMHAERDHLVTVVFPELRERVERLGLEFYDVDLRWGVPASGVDEEVANSWEYCKRWIDRVKPFFVCMLAQRYGWIPSAPEIEDELDRAEFEGMSITEMEIRHAVLTGRMSRRSFFYLRSTTVPENTPEALLHEFVDVGMESRLDHLKGDIRASGRPVRPYPCEWTGSGFADLDAFGALVLEDLWSGVLRDERYVSKAAWRNVLGREPDEDDVYTIETEPIPEEIWQRLVEEAKPPPRDPLNAEAEEMAAFAEARLRWFRGRASQLEQLHDFVDGDLPDDSSRLCVVAAVPGQGKSALIAKLAGQLRGSPHLVISHFVGATERSADVRAVMERLVQELDRNDVPAPPEEEAGADLESLRKRLAARLEDYEGDRRIVLLIDAVNQLSGGHDILWLPHRLGANARVVLTSIDEPSLPAGSPEARVVSALRARRPEPQWIELPPLDEADVKEIVREYLEEYCKVLDRDAIEQIAGMDQAKNPLYLLVMLNELRTLGGNDMQEIVPRLVRALPEDRPDTVSLFEWVLERLEVFGAERVQRWCAYLALGRVGMSSHELSELLEADFGEDGPQSALLIERGIRRYLQRRGPQLAFFHGQLATAVDRRYLGNGGERRVNAHRALAGYFRQRADPHEQREWDAYPRGLSELPYHLTEGAGEDEATWQELFDTLTDFRFLERKATDVGAVEQPDADGGTMTVYTGVFQLQDDFARALKEMGGAGADRGDRRRIIVTATDFGEGMVVRCPHCNTVHTFDTECLVCSEPHDLSEWRGNEVTCPKEKCHGPLKVNDFVVGPRARR